MEPLYTKLSSLIQKFAVAHKQAIIRLFFIYELVMVLVLIAGATLSIFSPQTFLTFYEIGLKAGTMSACFLALAVTPGILGRFQWFTTPRITMMLFRRHFGISMYVNALVHSSFVFWFPSLKFGFAPLLLFQVYGILTALILFPLFLTSNDFAVRTLKVWWNRIHKLVYLGLFFGAMHTLTTSPTVGYLLMTLVILEIWSYGYKFYVDNNTSR